MSEVKVLKKPKLKEPVVIVGLPGIGNVGRITAGYMIEEMGAEKFAQFYSKHFFPFVVLHDNSKTQLLRNYFHYWKSKKKKQNDIIFITGDSQAQSPAGHYEVARQILDFLEDYEPSQLFTIGGLATGEVEEEPQVYASVNHKKLIEEYKKHDLNFDVGKKVGYIVGAAGLLPGLARERGIDGMCLLGETSGFPIVTDPKAAENVLNILTDILGIDLDMSKLDKKVEEMEKFIKKIESLQRKAIKEMAKSEKAPVKGDQLRYIG